MVVGLFFVLLMYEEGSPERNLQIWAVLLFLMCSLVYLFDRYVTRIGLNPDNSERFFIIRCGLGCLMTALLGASVLLLPNEASRTAYTFVFIITISVVAAGYLAYPTAFLYCLLVNAFALFPLSAYSLYRYADEREVFFLLMGIAAILWQILFATKAYRVSKSVVGEIVSKQRLHDEMAERRQTEQALRASEAKSQELASMLRLMCDNVPDMIWAKDMEGRFLFVNKAFSEKMLNAAGTEEPVGKTYEHYVELAKASHPDDPEWYSFGEYSHDVDLYVLSRSEPTVYEESGNVCGKFVFLDNHRARFVNAQGEVIGTVGCARDITERKASEDFVRHLAHHDALTDLPNRVLLTDRMRQALAQARRDRGKLAVLFVDLDRLKPVNDTLGHDIGDILLQEVARRLREVVVREADTVSRLGGDEFVILLQRVSKDQDAGTVAGKILEALNAPFTIMHREISISASIGIAIFPHHGEDAAQLLKNADTAMYAAKHDGRNGFRFFDETMAR